MVSNFDANDIEFRLVLAIASGRMANGIVTYKTTPKKQTSIRFSTENLGEEKDGYGYRISREHARLGIDALA